MPDRPATVSSRAVIGSVALALAATLVFLALPAAASASKGRVAWLCRPGKQHNPCMRGQRTTLVSPTGERIGTKRPHGPRHRKIDCFYVYPTVSDQQTANANLHIDPEERSIALYQAARYSQYCRVYAPMYRQLTLKQILDPSSITEHMTQVAYNSALRAWKKYLRKYNDGRGVVLIGHSQGSFILRALIQDQIDPNRHLRKRIVSAILLGGNILVADGSTAGGDFQHVPACESSTQLHCVIAFSTFNAPVPSDAVFGRTTQPGLHVLCTNPAALGGGLAGLRTIYPSKPFAPNTTIGAATRAVGLPTIRTKARWIQANGAYSGQCSSADGANVLQIQANDGAPDLRPIPNAAWGLHLTDANIALGNLIGVVRHEIRSYVRGHG
jgi:pimeloyl-ACP methyl ester carboxylesterase